MALVDVNIKVPVEMAVYLKPSDQSTELERNALLLYPYVLKQSISHGRAAEIISIVLPVVKINPAYLAEQSYIKFIFIYWSICGILRWFDHAYDEAQYFLF